MHELSITQEILDLVLEQAKKAEAKEIGKINLVIGEMCGVSYHAILYWMRKFNITRRDGSFQKGNQINMGKKYTKEHRTKISESLVDKTAGEKHAQWKGGGRAYWHRQARKVYGKFYYYFIPNGFDVHHRDGNYKNNDIENLVLLTHAHHAKVHGQWQR